MSGHVVLLGDSIFDNGVYVTPGGTSVIEHLRRALPAPWRGSLLAVDGATVAAVDRQLARVPSDATHLVLSVGGNDALWMAGNVFTEVATDVRSALQVLAEPIEGFSRAYRGLVQTISRQNLPLALCTIYDRIPGLTGAEKVGLCVFNDVISRTAFEIGATLIDLRLVCDEKTDYAAVSPIEPSSAGGSKIARAIVRALLDRQDARQVVI